MTIFSSIHRSYKITPRSQNAHAYVNAAFLAKIGAPDFAFQEVPRIVYGGISASFSRAEKTETFLRGQRISGNEILQQAFKKLDEEAKPDIEPILTDPVYRRHLVKALFYKV